MGAYEAVIGLEVHVHLATKSKLFCSCSTQFGAEPNTNVCEICSAMPGTLPTPNREAIRLAVLVGLAANCVINKHSVFARKNYFYPDLPAGYQISQFDLPICEKGFLELENKKVGITRIHMENDAGKNIHSSHMNLSFVDLNRAGVPLIEIVSEPDMRSPEEAFEYLKQLHSLVTYLGASDGNMEEGSFRCDANVSIRPAGSTILGTRTELKNLNSFRHVLKAIEYEIGRQEDILQDGGIIRQETRLYDAETNRTQPMRSKEEAEDYRYFPDPDLLPVVLNDEEIEEIRKSIPELPKERSNRFMNMTGLPKAEVEMLVQTKEMADFFENAVQKSDAKKIASYILGPISRYCNNNQLQLHPKNWKLSPDALAQMAQLEAEGTISAKIAADILPTLLDSGQMPKDYVLAHGLAQISDASAIETAVDMAMKENPKAVEELKAGKNKLMGFFVGQVMRSMKGKANPAIVNEILQKKLKDI